MTTDRLALAHVIEEAGIARHDNVATKQDIERLEPATTQDLAAVRSEMTAMEQRLNVRFEQVERRIDEVVVQLGAAMVVMLGLLFTAQHYWLPAHG